MARLFQDDSQDVHLTLNGFKLFGLDDYGSEWHTSFQDVSGLFDGVGSNIAMEKLALADGEYSNSPTRTGRSISIIGYISGNCPDVLLKSWDALKGALLLREQLLTVEIGSIRRETTVMQSSGAPIIAWAGKNMLKYSIGLVSTSPYLYNGDGPLTGSTFLPVTGGGRTYPASGYTFEGPTPDKQWVFQDTTISGSITLISNGNAPSPVLIRIDGPVQDPVVTHRQSGRVLRFGITLGAGQNLTADGATRVILVDGQAPDKTIRVERGWANARAGVNTWLFSADKNSSEAKLTVSFKEAFV